MGLINPQKSLHKSLLYPEKKINAFIKGWKSRPALFKKSNPPSPLLFRKIVYA